MRNLLKCIAGGSLLITLLFACKGSVTIGTVDDLSGKWMVKQQTKKGFDRQGNLIFENTAGGTTNDYFDFRGGTLYSSVNNANDTILYQQISEDSIVIQNGFLDRIGLMVIATKANNYIGLKTKINAPQIAPGGYVESYTSLIKN